MISVIEGGGPMRWPYGAGHLVNESITGLLQFGAVSDGGYRGTCPHVSVESRSIEKASGKATSTDKLEVKMLPHVAEGRVRVLVDDCNTGKRQAACVSPRC